MPCISLMSYYISRRSRQEDMYGVKTRRPTARSKQHVCKTSGNPTHHLALLSHTALRLKKTPTVAQLPTTKHTTEYQFRNKEQQSRNDEFASFPFRNSCAVAAFSCAVLLPARSVEGAEKPSTTTETHVRRHLLQRCATTYFVRYITHIQTNTYLQIRTNFIVQHITLQHIVCKRAIV